MTNERMRIITINISERELSAIEKLVKLGIFASRSEFCRGAVKDKISSEIDFINKTEEIMEDFTPKNTEEIQDEDYIVIPGYKTVKLVRRGIKAR